MNVSGIVSETGDHALNEVECMYVPCGGRGSS